MTIFRELWYAMQRAKRGETADGALRDGDPGHAKPAAAELFDSPGNADTLPVMDDSGPIDEAVAIGAGSEATVTDAQVAVAAPDAVSVAAHDGAPPRIPRTVIPLASGHLVRRSFDGPAGMRAYRLYVPRGYDGRPCPLVVMLHGCTQTPDDFAAGTRMNALADEHVILVAYPEQSVSANPSKCWNWFSLRDQQRGRGEPSIIVGIVDRIAHDYAVDRSRVYAAGMSAGAAAAAVLGATYPDVFAAIGVHSGLACGVAHDIRSALAAMRDGDGDSDSEIARRRGTTHGPVPVPTIVFHGDRDGTVHPRNGDRFFDQAALAECDKAVIDGRVPGGRAYTQTTFAAAGEHSVVLEQWVIHGAGHAWSGGSSSGSYTDPRGPDASREMLRFFLSQRLPIPAQTAAGA